MERSLRKWENRPGVRKCLNKETEWYMYIIRFAYSVSSKQKREDKGRIPDFILKINNRKPTTSKVSHIYRIKVTRVYGRRAVW